MAHEVQVEELEAAVAGEGGLLVFLKPPFSGHHTGKLLSMEDHPSQTGIKVYGIDFGEGRVESLMDWTLRVPDGDDETYEMVFPASASPGIAKPKKSKAAPKTTAAASEESAAAPRPKTVPGLTGTTHIEGQEIPPGYKLSVWGSNRLTRSDFAPGEDATAKSLLLKVQRGQQPFSALPSTIVEYIRTNEKWNNWFGDVAAMTDDSHYEATKAAKAAALNKTESAPAAEQAEAEGA